MSKMKKRRRKRRKKKAAERRAQKGDVKAPKRRNSHVVGMRQRGGKGFHGTKQGKKGYRRHPKHKGGRFDNC